MSDDVAKYRAYLLGSVSEEERDGIELQDEPIFREEIVAHIRSDRRPLPRAVKRVTTPLGELRYRAAPRTRLGRVLGRD